MCALYLSMYKITVVFFHSLIISKKFLDKIHYKILAYILEEFYLFYKNQ